ncbi:hypothetical protein ILUMI_06201 [Ignelater luminosus]|uniref:ABC transmembrane type-2 domain-containing protein n=1 Tax=Ignelater luminosus TaxID=2038154 RepID=A0A8K0GCT7_IGNLU|nr:hypothetical protein ILUMI_06201 [Ignelater luminosus]
MEDVGSDNVNADRLSSSPSNTSYPNNTKPRSKKHHSVINIIHLRALLWKNFSWMIRNTPMMLCVLVLPVLQGVIFCLSVGHDPINLPIAVVNRETTDAGNCQNNITCDSVHLGCSYLKYLEKRDLILTYYDSEEMARESVLKAETYASVVVKQNYSSALKARLETWTEAEPWDIYFSDIDVFRDVSNKFVAQYLKVTMYNTFKSFVEDYLASCNAESRWVIPPIKWERPVYGTTYPNFTDFVAPGVIVTFTSFLGMGLTGLAMLLERKEGIFERLLITGVNEIEMLISHGLCQFVVMVMQSIGTLVSLFVLFDITNQGSFVLLVSFTLLSGLFGMCLGICISCIFSSEVPALFAALGSFLPMILSCGIIWPVEGMHYLIRSIAFLFPLTQPAECLRSIMQRGWDLSSDTVYLGFIVISVWSVMLLIISIFILKFRKM